MIKGFVILIDGRKDISDFAPPDFDYRLIPQVVEAVSRKLGNLPHHVERQDDEFIINVPGQRIVIPVSWIRAKDVCYYAETHENDSLLLFCENKPNANTKSLLSGNACADNKLLYSFTLPQPGNKEFFLRRGRRGDDGFSSHHDRLCHGKYSTGNSHRGSRGTHRQPVEISYQLIRQTSL